MTCDKQQTGQFVTPTDLPSVVAYDVIRSRRRSSSIEVHPDGTILVRVPLRATREYVETFVHFRRDWIRSRLAKASVARSVIPPLSEPRQFHHRGRAVQWKPEHGISEPVLNLEDREGALLLPARRAATEEAGWRLVRTWQRTAADALFRELIREHMRDMGVQALRYRDLKLRRMRRRWGSCTSTGVLTLNETLIRTPDVCIRAVVVHELCHLIHLHHGPAFHDQMAQMLPDYRAYDALLDRWSTILLEDKPITANGAEGPVERRLLALTFD